MIGNPIDGEEPIRIRVVMELDGLRPMQSAWVVGDGVDEAINDGSIILLGAQPQLGRLWRVGQHTYHDKSIAERVAAQTGQTMVEVA